MPESDRQGPEVDPAARFASPFEAATTPSDERLEFLRLDPFARETEGEGEPSDSTG